MRAVLKAQINKTDRNDARGIAQMMRAGLYRRVHVKTLRSQKVRILLTHRKLLQSKAVAIENDLRATLRNFGLKVGMVGTVKFEARLKELVEKLPDLAVLVEPLLAVRRVLREQVGILQRRLLVIVRDDDVCRRLMTTGCPPPASQQPTWRGSFWFTLGSADGSLEEPRVALSLAAMRQHACRLERPATSGRLLLRDLLEHPPFRLDADKIECNRGN